MPAILDSLFHKEINTTSIPIGVEGGGWWGATKWQEVPIQKLSYDQMASIQAVFSSTRFKMWLHRCPVSPASPVVIPCRLSAWLGKLEPLTDHPNIRGRQTGS